MGFDPKKIGQRSLDFERDWTVDLERSEKRKAEIDEDLYLAYVVYTKSIAK